MYNDTYIMGMCVYCVRVVYLRKQSIPDGLVVAAKDFYLYIYIYTYNVQDARTIIRVYNMYYNKRLLYTRHSTAPCIKCTHYITYITLPTEKKKKKLLLPLLPRTAGIVLPTTTSVTPRRDGRTRASVTHNIRIAYFYEVRTTRVYRYLLCNIILYIRLQ